MLDSMILSKNEALSYVGGASAIKATLITAITSAAKFLYEMGQNLGSSIKRYRTNTMC